MILTSREADPLIREAVRTGELISDDVARTIAHGLQSAAEKDVPVTALSHGLAFDARALLARVDELIKSVEFRASETLVELHALREWALSRVPHIAVTVYRMDSDAWEVWCGQWGESDSDQPDGIEPYVRDVWIVADVADDIGAWSYPGYANYPANPHTLPGYDESDDGVWMPGTLTDAAVALLSGKGGMFWAQGYDASPFAPGESVQGESYEDAGPGKPYVSRYVHPYTGDAEIVTAVLVGFTPDQEAEVYRAWR